MKTHCLTLLTLLFLPFLLTAQQPKYIFYFIGDGMGLNQVNGTEMYQAAINGNHGCEPLLFTTFPHGGMVTTYSHSNPITDSAAAGTALSTGQKTTNGTIGMDHTQNVVLHNLAEKASEKGASVGIVTTVSIDHATPAAFYSHKPLRSTFYEIGSELPASGFDFFAGGGLLEPISHKDSTSENIFDLIRERGYTVARGKEEYQAKKNTAGKMIWLQEERCSPDAVPFAIDRCDSDLSLPEMIENAIEFLTSGNNPAGFFLMTEGGKIDWAGHSNDAATVFHEVIDFDQAIRKAYDFYRLNPDSTLIVVTADHETGGMGLGVRRYKLPLELLANQKKSQAELSKDVLRIRIEARKRAQKPEWEELRDLLKTNLGFWEGVEVTADEEKELYALYEDMIANEANAETTSEYFVEEKLIIRAVGMLNRKAHIGWSTHSHTAGYVPVFAIGAGAEKFTGLMDNTAIPHRIAEIAGYK